MTNHYHSGEWRDYRLDKVNASKRRRMEQHLARCDSCLQIYTAAAGEEEAAAAELLLPAEFTGLVLRRVKNMKQKDSSARRRRILLQYAAAASITLALTAGGFFEAAAREIPQMMKGLDLFSQEVSRLAEIKWSDKLVETASAGINSFLFEKEDYHEKE